MKVLLRAVCFLILFGIYSASDDLSMFAPFGSNPPPLPECPPNEMYYFCMNNCSTCEHRGVCCSHKNRDVCVSFDCSRKGCDCVPDYFRLEPGGSCQPVSKCPIPKCGENEVFRECGPAFEGCKFIHSISIHCSYKCYCKKGYRKNDENECIPENDCPKIIHCRRTEELLDSGPMDQYCIHEESVEVNNSTMNKTQCYCKEGFKRNTIGYCTPEKYCMTECFNEQVFQNCPRRCNSTCSNYGDPNCKEDGQCYPGCFCPEGLVMNSHSKCITPENCEPDLNPYFTTGMPNVEVTIPDSVNSSSLEEVTKTTTTDSLNENTSADEVAIDEGDVEETEDVEDETEEIEGLTDEDIVDSSTSQPKSSPTKRPRNQKAQPLRNPKISGQNAFTHISEKSGKSKPSPTDGDDMFDNE